MLELEYICNCGNHGSVYIRFEDDVPIKSKQPLLEMTFSGGRDTERDLFNCPGGYRTKLSAKTKGAPCPICGNVIVREAFLGGNIYYCPGCQKHKKGENIKPTIG